MASVRPINRGKAKIMSLLPGLLLGVVGGMLNGSFTAPMKFSSNWAWENSWLIYSVIGLLCIPIAIALIFVPDLVAVYQAASPGAVALAMLFGFGWGVGSVLFGLGIHMLGMALGFAIILGLTAALGSLIPLIVLSPQALFTAHGVSVLVGCKDQGDTTNLGWRLYNADEAREYLMRRIPAGLLQRIPQKAG
jgi:L-rhamnose-H+ transport protein